MPEDSNNAVPKIGKDSIGFPVSAKKFFIMSVCTCSIYRFYWAYKQFRCTRVGQNNHFFAAFYSLFLPISLPALMSGLETRAEEQGTRFQFDRKIGVAACFFVLWIAGRFLELFLLAQLGGLIATCVLYKVQRQINLINAEAHPEIAPDSKFSAWDRVGILLVVMVLASKAILPRIFPH